MTRVQQRIALLAAALVLAAGCALALCMPQQAHAIDQLKAGSTAQTATAIPLTANGLVKSGKSEFNSSYDNCYYKFTTSSRASSSYKLKLKSYNSGVGYIYVTVYDATMHRVANMKVPSAKTRTWLFKNLKPSSVYYIELWRFVTKTDDFVESGVINGSYQEEQGESAFLEVPYYIYLKEVVAKPVAKNVKAVSKAKKKLTITWDEPYNASGVQIEIYQAWKSRGKSSLYYRTFTKSTTYTTQLQYNGSTHPYKIRVRAFTYVNGNKVYGKWRNAKYTNYYGTSEQSTSTKKVYIK